ncbi:c-type cytochrome [Algoriphagus machipongonensis]|uniref:Cytochrome c family protein n=1 Tax=Algoriphagus machipongonensis TaxID=388413 RepID=A3HZ29_9BACT|nr:cytochrome c [Algoriphagus machipongonensis]EAZ80515.1 putative cytochrome c family protein [Algoriphagus machipongonensis]
MKNLLGVTVVLVGVALTVLIFLMLFVQTNWDKKYESPYPDLRASTDSTIIARGKYLVYGPAHCAACHSGAEDYEAMESGEQVPLRGGEVFIMKIGKIVARNLTPDEETGIGRLSDGEIARAMRDAIGHDGRVLPAFMPFKLMTDEDVIAVISFLRSQKGVNNNIPDPEYSRIGKWQLSTGKYQPRKIEGEPLKSMKREATAVYGEYLVNSVANCVGCHSLATIKYGVKEFDIAPLSGGVNFGGKDINNFRFITPNLTPEKQTGIIANWDEETFVNRIKAGRVYEYSPMPWGNFSRMDEVDIRAIYRYLKSVKPVAHKIEKTVYAPGEAMPDF